MEIVDNFVLLFLNILVSNKLNFSGVLDGSKRSERLKGSFPPKIIQNTLHGAELRPKKTKKVDDKKKQRLFQFERKLSGFLQADLDRNLPERSSSDSLPFLPAKSKGNTRKMQESISKKNRTIREVIFLELLARFFVFSLFWEALGEVLGSFGEVCVGKKQWKI